MYEGLFNRRREYGRSLQDTWKKGTKGEDDGFVRFHIHISICKEEMARPSNCNPLSYLVERQIDDKVDYCKRLVNARFESSENLFRKDLLSHYGCVNAIEFSNQGDLLVSGKKLTMYFIYFIYGTMPVDLGNSSSTEN